MLLSRRVLMTAVLCLALLASASVAGAGVTILGSWMGGWGHVTPAHIGVRLEWSGGEGLYQDTYAVDHEYFGWHEGGFSEHFHSYSTSNRIGFYREASYWMSSPYGPSWMGYEFYAEAAFEVTRPYWVDGWWGSSLPDMSYMYIGGHLDPIWAPYMGPVLLSPGTYTVEILHSVCWWYDIWSYGSFSGHFDAGLQFTDPGADPIPEPAYLSFVALAIFGLATWRKRAERRSV